MISQITQNIFRLYFNTFGSNVYVLKLDNNILIDTSSKDNKKELLQNLKELNLTPEDIDIILLTHTHWDHNGNIDLFPNARVYTKDNINNLNIPDIKTIKTPGHTKDSICFLYNDILFSGDTIFHKDGIGRTDFPESQPEKMQESLNKLKKIKYNILCPGH